MVKAINVWSGYHSSGKAMHVAENEAGQFFMRVCEFNGYALAWTRWTLMKTAPDFLGNKDACRAGYSGTMIRSTAIKCRLPF